MRFPQARELHPCPSPVQTKYLRYLQFTALNIAEWLAFQYQQSLSTVQCSQIEYAGHQEDEVGNLGPKWLRWEAIGIYSYPDGLVKVKIE